MFPFALTPSRFPFPVYIFTLCFLFLLTSACATRFTFDEVQQLKTDSEDRKKSLYLDFSTLTNQVFGFTASGQVIANVNLTYENATNADQLPKCIGAVALCEASEAFVRDPSYQRRQASGVLTSLHKDFADFACDNDLVPTGKIGRCVSEQLCVGDKQYRFGTVENGLDPNHLYYLGAAACVGATPPSTDLDKKYIRLKGDAAFSNPSELFPELGYEEMLFPVLSGLATALLASLLLVELIGLVTAKYKSLKISNLVYIVCTATLLKNMAAALTFLYFWLLAQSGERQGWYLYTRLVISSLADVAYIIVVVGMSAGFGLIPPNWFVSGRSPVIVIYIGVTLQILIVIAVKLMFPFQYLGTITYTIAGLVIIILTTVSSYRNYCFLRRYRKLVERSHIYVKTTPIPQLQRFFLANIPFITLLYLTKVICVGLFDYLFMRPDLMWSCLEISDALLLVWYGLSAFPWARSALYVDMSNVNDLRLHEANAWRAGRATPQTSAEMHPSGQDSETFSSGNDGSGLSSSSSFRPHSGRELLPNLNSPGAASTAPWQLASQPDELNGDLGSVRVNVYPQDQDVAGERGDRQTVDSTADPRPPWVAWESGMALPRPTYSTWGTRVQRPSTVRRGRKFVSVVPSAIVLGTPTIEGSAFSLTIGMPILGPNSIPRTFNEKGTEVVNARASLGVLEALGAQSARAENETSSPVGHDSRWFASWRRLRGTPRISIHGEGASSQVTPHGADIFDEETGSGAEGMRASLEALRRRISRESGSPSQSSDGILHGSRSRTGDDPLDG